MHVAAQSPTQVSLANTNALVMNAVTTPAATPSGAAAANCPALAAGTCQLANGGNYGQYTVLYTTTSPMLNLANLQLRLEACFDNTNNNPASPCWVPISETATDPTGGMIQASGYFPAVRLNLISLNNVASLSAFYSSVSGSSPLSGIYNPAQQITRVSLSNQSAAASASGTAVTTPFANSYGTLVLAVLNAAPIHSGATLEVVTFDSLGLQTIIGLFPVSTASSVTYIPLPPFSAAKVQALYTTGGAGAGNIFANFVFSPPPIASGFPSANISLNVVTLLKTGAGIWHSLTVNTGVATGVVTVKDGVIVAGSCNGTTLATINTATAGPTYLYDIQFLSGLCITPSGTAGSDITFTWR
jgi:hypothetical protein